MRSISEKLIIVVGVVALVVIIVLIVVLPSIPSSSKSTMPSASSLSSAASQALGGSWIVNTSMSAVGEVNVANSSISVTYMNGTKKVTPLSGPAQIPFGSTTLNLGYPVTAYFFYLMSPVNQSIVAIVVYKYSNSTIPSETINYIHGQTGVAPSTSSGLSYFVNETYGYTILVGSDNNFLVVILGNYTAPSSAYAALASRAVSLVGGP